jgi:dihydropyrimidinase
VRILLRGGTVVTASDVVHADVLVEDQHVAAVGLDLEIPADRVIDVHGRYVMPGGVDVNTHLGLGAGELTSPEDFFTGTRAAAFGGTTTVVDFATQVPGESLREALDRAMGNAERSCTDYGFHVFVSEVTDSVLKEMDVLAEEGITSFKLSMAYPGPHLMNDGAIFRAMLQASEIGALVLMHAENGGPIEVLVRDCIAAGKTDPIFHARTRPPSLEAEAVHRTYALAELSGAAAYVANLSSRHALHEVEAARDRGVQAYAETCPQYLVLSEAELERPAREAATFVCSPPLRPKDHHDELWTGLVQGHLQVVASDHAPYTRAQKELGRDNFELIPRGLPTVEDRVTLLFEEGVRGGRFTVNRFVDLVATAASKLFGLYPRKGTVAPGSDADLAVFDPEASRTISASAQHMNVDYSCFEGMRAWGLPELVMQRGRIIVQGGEFLGREGGGHFLPRGASVL